MDDKLKIDDFYTKLFCLNSNWSSKYPNFDEVSRGSKICEFLSRIVANHLSNNNNKLRILDLGCGRGWLTNWVSVFGQAEGVDPVLCSIQQAQKNFPNINFHSGTAEDLHKANNFQPYDIVITSEVIEHVIDKVKFVREIAGCLKPNGFVIITTPRGEEYKKWQRLGIEEQPIEEWVSEKYLSLIFRQNNFVPIYHDRVYIDKPGMSILHRICSSKKISHFLNLIGSTWVMKGIQYIAGVYQVWCFQLKS